MFVQRSERAEFYPQARKVPLPMSEVSQNWRSMLDVMPSGWTTPAALASRTGRDVEETIDLLAALDDAGLIHVRETEDAEGPIVALSPRGVGVVRAAAARTASRDRQDAGSWTPGYRPVSSRSRMAVTAAGSVAS